VVTARWLTVEEVERDVNPALLARKMAALNLNVEIPTCRVAGAFVDGRLVRAFCFHLFPLLGPLVETDSEFRDNGEATRVAVDFMDEFLHSVGARGWMAVCENPVSERLALRHRMTKLESPVYVATGG
jgi:hypothetical protein